MSMTINSLFGQSQLDFASLRPESGPAALAQKRQRAKIDETTLLCLRINCAIGASTRALFGLYTLLPPAQLPGSCLSDESLARELAMAVKELDPKLYRKCHSAETDKALEGVLDFLISHPVTVLHPYATGYPPRLQEIPDRPLALYALGDIERLRETQVAIVGSRRASPPARRIAADLARQLSQSGVVVCSGLARGCDLAAHLGCCEMSGEDGTIDIIPARTVAVLGHGIDLIYPSQHKRVADKIAANGGCLISEFNPGSPPLPHNFPKRNRIIAGISVATIVIEAGLKSGSLISARLANEYGRDVFAVPSSPAHATARGCHKLIKEGAHLLEDCADLADVLADRWPVFGPLNGESQAVSGSAGGKRRLADLSPAFRRYLSQIGAEGAEVGEFAQACSINIVQAQTILLDFEIKGLVRQTLTGKFFRMV